MFLCIFRTTILAAVAFLDAFQKVADMATNSRGKKIFYSTVLTKPTYILAFRSVIAL